MGAPGMGGVGGSMMHQSALAGQHQMPGQPPGGPGQPGGAAPRQESQDEAEMRRLQERQHLAAQGFGIMGQVLQLGAMLASSGHQLLSVAVGTTFAVNTFRAIARGEPIPSPMAPPGLGPFGTTPAEASHPVEKTVATHSGNRGGGGGVGGAARKLISSPAAMAAVVAFVVVAQHLWRLWQQRQERLRLEEEERYLGVNAESAASEAAYYNDRRAASDPAVSSPVRALPGPKGEGAAAGTGDATFVARHSFEAAAANQLSIAPGDQLVIDEFSPEGWCWARVTGVRQSGGPSEGFIPGNFVERVVTKRRL